MKEDEKERKYKDYKLISPKPTQFSGTVRLQSLKSSISRVENIISRVQKFGQEISEQIKPFLELAGRFDAFVKSVDWDSVEERWILLAEKIGSNGWTLALNMDLKDLLLMADLKDKAEIDQIFINFFKEKENFLVMKENVLKNESLSDFHELLEQCFDNYENGNYLIAIPSLFSIVEGYANELILEQYKRTPEFKPQKRVSLPNMYKEVQKYNDTSFKDVVYISALLFLEKSFDPKAFNDDPAKDSRPILINRHRVLHGRDNPSLWTQVDALRLFNTIDTLSALEVPEIKAS